MSFTFNFQSSNKADAKSEVAARLQSALELGAHTPHVDQAAATANSFIDLLPDDDSRDVDVNMSGSVVVVDNVICGVNAQIAATLVERGIFPRTEDAEAETGRESQNDEQPAENEEQPADEQ